MSTTNGSSGDDTIVGGIYNDNLNGGSGDDTIDGGGGNDKISGGSGEDTLNGGSGSDTVNGGSGSDTLVYNIGENNTNPLGTVDVYTGGSGSDTLVIQMTLPEWAIASYRTQLFDFMAKLVAVTNAKTGEVSNSTNSDYTFTFGESKLTVQMTEKLEVYVGTVKVIDSTDRSALPPSAPDLIAASDSGASNTDSLTNVTTPTFSGSGAEPFATVKLYDGASLVGTGTADLSGNWSITTSSSLADGEHTLTVKQTDLMGNTSAASAALPITIDTQAPTVAVNIVDTALNDGDNSSQVTFTFSEAPVNFTAADISAVGGTVSGLTATGNPLVYTATFTAADDFDGTGSVTVGTAWQDAAGNTGVGGSDNVAIDTVNPTVTIAEDNADGVVSDADNVVNYTLTFSEAVQSVTAGDLTITGGTLTGGPTLAVDGLSATFQVTATDNSTTDLKVVVKDTIVDANGNTLVSNSNTLTVDTVNPTVLSVTANDSLITDADAVADTFSIAVVFDQAMNTGATPTLTFAPAVASTLSFTGGVWSAGNTVYTASYNVADANVELANVTVAVTGAQDANGNAQVNYTPLTEFSIDTTNPTAAGETILVNNDPSALPEWLLLLNDGSGALDIQNGSVVSLSGGTASHVVPGGNGTGEISFDFTGTGVTGSFTYNVIDGVGNTASASATITRPSTTSNFAITGTAGNDIVFGYTGNDTLNGGAGDDTYAFRGAGDGSDTITELSGADRIMIGTNGTALTALNFFDSSNSANQGHLVISYGAETITVTDYFATGTTNVDSITFVGGATYAGYSLGSSLYTLSLDDADPREAAVGVNTVLTGDANGAVLTGNTGNDLLFGGNSGDTLAGGTGNDLLVGGTGNDNISGDGGNDTIVHRIGDGADTVTGGNDTDTLAILGTAAANESIAVVVTGGGIAQVAGGSVSNVENFTLDLGAGSGDTLSYASTLAAQSIAVNLATGSATGFTSPIVGVENVTGGAGNDTLTGDSGDNKLIGGAGIDSLVGGDGNDILNGGAGNDVLTGGNGVDQFRLATNTNTDTITAFLPGTDKIGFLEGTGTGAVNFGVDGTTAGEPLDNVDGEFTVRTSIANINNTDDNQLVLINATQTNSQITTGTGGNASNLYVVVYNSDVVAGGRAEIWFDTNWNDLNNRSLVAVLDGVTAGEVATTLTASDFVVYSSAADPLILDLGAAGLNFSGLADGVQFDINGDGVLDQMAWTAGEDGILALDVDGSGTIDNGTEIFSPWFPDGYASSLAALASLDSNGDGVIDGADAQFGSLLVWQDFNHDGISDAGELATLADHAIVSINLNATPGAGDINGQELVSQGTFQYADGSSGSFAEVGFEAEIGSVAGQTLTGTAGSDTFVFDGSGGVDTVIDFNASGSADGDFVELSAAAYGGLTTAAGNGLAAGEFAAADGAVTVDAAARVVFDAATGNLYYDADGGDAAGRELLATLHLGDPTDTFDHNDIKVGP